MKTKDDKKAIVIAVVYMMVVCFIISMYLFLFYIIPSKRISETMSGADLKCDGRYKAFPTCGYTIGGVDYDCDTYQINAWRTILVSHKIHFVCCRLKEYNQLECYGS